MIARLRDEIAAADGNEVLFVCSLDEDGMIYELDVSARGNLGAVPAVAEHMERGQVVVHNHPSSHLRPSDADLEIAARLGDNGIGSMIVDNDVAALYVVVEPVVPQRLQPLDPQELQRVCGADGALAETLEAYEARSSQLEMLRFVAQGLNDGGVYVAEAGTGVGKSIAYLVPVFAWLERNPGRVVISTATINLQQQLIEKDVPLVKRALRSELQAVLVKGRGNYLCPARLEEATAELGVIGEDDDPELSAVAAWAAESDTGGRSDLPFTVTDEVWNRVNSDADHCSARRCRSRERCFLMKARRAAAAARVLVVNHHLLFSDLAIRLRGTGFEATAVLPPFQHVVFDEAHHLENSATSYFSQSFSPQALEKQCSRLHRRRRGRDLGLLVRLEKIPGDNEALKHVPALLEEMKAKMQELNRQALQIVGDHTGLWLPPIEPERYEDDEQQQELNRLIREFQQQVLDVVELLTDRLLSSKEADREQEPALVELIGVVRRLETIASIAEQVLRRDEHPELVSWIERREPGEGRPATVRFTVTPLEIRDLMHEAVYLPYRGVFFTSATLTVRNEFRHWAARVGLDDERLEQLEMRRFDSPFDYRNHVLLAVPRDAPTPDTQAYTRFLIEFLKDALEVSEGSALILFTSYRMLSEVYAAVKPRLNELGITTFRQGDDDRARLLKRFNQDLCSVLFATESFWAGVDAPGATLRVVVLCRLPFRVPSDPVLIARTERIKARGGNAFMELILPDAVMRFRQGFGRLIRSAVDRGVVIISDTRVLTKPYGRAFVDSVPETSRVFEDRGAVLRELERFLYAET